MPSQAQTSSSKTTQTIDPRINSLALKLDRYIFSQRDGNKPITVGLAVAAIGTLLAQKPDTPENMENLIADMVSAIRIGYYLRDKQ
jgi:hypothetical protein